MIERVIEFARLEDGDGRPGRRTWRAFPQRIGALVGVLVQDARADQARGPRVLDLRIGNRRPLHTAPTAPPLAFVVDCLRAAPVMVRPGEHLEIDLEASGEFEAVAFVVELVDLVELRRRTVTAGVPAIHLPILSCARCGRTIASALVRAGDACGNCGGAYAAHDGRA